MEPAGQGRLTHRTKAGCQEGEFTKALIPGSFFGLREDIFIPGHRHKPIVICNNLDKVQGYGLPA